MKGRLLVVGIACLAGLVLAGGGAYIYFFSGLRSSPGALSLSATPSPTASGALPAGSPAASTSTAVTGSWKVTTGSVAGYRVKELFVGQTSKHDAVARTSTISGGLTVNGDSSGYQISAITFTAVLTGLASVDSVAGRDVTQRDSFVSRQMDLQQFPEAIFAATSASVAGTVTSQPVDASVSGKLTIHGVTKDVTATVKAQVIGGKIEIAGNVPIVMTDFGVSPPSVPFTTVDSQVTIEFDIFLAQAA
jgi:polyisoprenoid-binding protein YceI